MFETTHCKTCLILQLDFQDSVGTALLSICRCVPGGVLMFMPSYALMDKLTRRWQVGEGHACTCRGFRYYIYVVANSATANL